jgi:hypothetical protein
MSNVLIRLAMALDEELGGGARWDRLIVDDAARAHRETARRLAGAALRALTEMDWPDVRGRIDGSDGPVGVVIPGRTVRNLVRRALTDEGQPSR